MKKPDERELKVRNWVKKAADELGLKPSRHKDRKHDYSRRDRHQRDPAEDSLLHGPSRKRGDEEYSRADQDWYIDFDEDWPEDLRMEPEEDSPDPEEVQ